MGNVYSKRRMVCVMPVEAVIGKLCPRDQKVNRDNAGFKCFVGYQMSNSVFNRFRVMSRPRSTDVTEFETSQRAKFKTAVKATRARMLDPTQYQTDMVAFSKQTKYKTFYQYVFNQEWSKLS